MPFHLFILSLHHAFTFFWLEPIESNKEKFKAARQTPKKNSPRRK